MIRALITTGRAALPRWPILVLAPVVLLAGCVTSDYRYREDNGGGYYYGTPSVEYREVTPYPYGGYGYGGYGYYGPYRSYPGPYGYRRYGHDPYYGYGIYRYSPYGYWRGDPYRYVPRRPRSVDPTPDRSRSPWRDFDELRRRHDSRLPPPPVTTPASPSVRPTAPAAGSGMGERIRRAKERASGREDTR